MATKKRKPNQSIIFLYSGKSRRHLKPSWERICVLFRRTNAVVVVVVVVIVTKGWTLRVRRKRTNYGFGIILGTKWHSWIPPRGNQLRSPRESIQTLCPLTFNGSLHNQHISTIKTTITTKQTIPLDLFIIIVKAHTYTQTKKIEHDTTQPKTQNPKPKPRTTRVGEGVRGGGVGWGGGRRPCTKNLIQRLAWQRQKQSRSLNRVPRKGNRDGIGIQ